MPENIIPGGWLGPGQVGIASRALYLAELVTNAAGNALLAGEVVRVNGNLTVTRAQADIAANATGVVGAMRVNTALGAQGQVSNSGYSFVLLEAALAPVAGNALWLSATAAGRATNIAPALPVYLGVIKDASMYAATGGVMADLTPGFVLSTVATLREVYNFGVAAADQTMTLTDARGGGIVVDATNAGFTGATAFSVAGVGPSTAVAFPRAGGVTITSTRTISVPAAISTWDALLGATSLLTLVAGGVSPSKLSFVRVQAPSITQTVGVGYTIPIAATVTIAGPPIASAVGGQAPTITALYALHVELGNVRFDDTNFSVYTANAAGYRRFLVSAGDTAKTEIAIGNAYGPYMIGLEGPPNGNPYINTYNKGIYFKTDIGGTHVIATLNSDGDWILGRVPATTYTSQSMRLDVTASKTIASAAGAIYDGVKFAASAVSITGNTAITTATGFNFFTVQAPTITGNTATCVIDYSASQYISGAPIAGANVNITNPYALWIDAGNTRFDGNVGIGTAVFGANAAACLALSNSATAPTTSVDLCHLYCADHNAVAGAAALAVYQEAALVASGDKVATHEWLVTLNGTPMWILCRNAA